MLVNAGENVSGNPSRPHMTQPRVMHVMVGEESKAKGIAQVVVTVDVDGAKNKLEVLEERLRAIEGGSS